MNFPMQANGAEMLRLACCLATERGIAVCAPVHDALLIEAPAGRDRRARGGAAGVHARGEPDRARRRLELGSDAKVVRWPERYADERGEVMWDTVTRLLREAAQPSRAA